jgi:hypothetical protein
VWFLDVISLEIIKTQSKIIDKPLQPYDTNNRLSSSLMGEGEMRSGDRRLVSQIRLLKAGR